MSSPDSLTACAALVLLALGAGSARAQHPVDNTAAAMTAVRDPQSGQLRPATAAELRALGAAELALRPAAAPGPVKLRSDGRREVHLGEAALTQATVRRESDGRLTMECVEGEAVHARH